MLLHDIHEIFALGSMAPKRGSIEAAFAGKPAKGAKTAKTKALNEKVSSVGFG